MSSTTQVPIGIKKVAVLCLLRCKGQVLLLIRAKEPRKGLYSPVGGKVEPYETPLDAATRETFEETGIRISTFSLCGILSDTSPTSFNWMSWVFIADIDYHTPKACDEGVLEWVEIDKLPHIPKPPADKYLYEYMFQNQYFAFNAVYDDTLQLLELKECFQNKILYQSPSQE